MTDLEMTAWDAMLDALHRCSVVLPIGQGDGILTDVEAAISLAEQARDLVEGVSDLPESVARNPGRYAQTAVRAAAHRGTYPSTPAVVQPMMNAAATSPHRSA